MAKKSTVSPRKPTAAKKKEQRKPASRVKSLQKTPLKSKPAKKASPAKKSPPKSAMKLLRKVVKKLASKKPAVKKPIAKKPIAKKTVAKKPVAKKVIKKVTAHKVSGKMVRGALVSKARSSAKPAVKSSAVVRTIAKASTRSARTKAPAERRALPHKAPPTQSFSFGDYFDGNASPYPTVPPGRREVLPVAVEWKEKMRPGELYQAFKRFFEANEIGNRLIGTLREGAASIVEFEGDPQIYKIVKIRGRAVFEAGRPASVEAYVKFSRHAVEMLLAPNATKSSEYVQRFAGLLTESDPSKRIEIKLLCTHGEAIRKGYLGVVAAGGKTLAEALVALHFALPSELVRQLR